MSKKSKKKSIKNLNAMPEIIEDSQQEISLDYAIADKEIVEDRSASNNINEVIEEVESEASVLDIEEVEHEESENSSLFDSLDEDENGDENDSEDSSENDVDESLEVRTEDESEDVLAAGDLEGTELEEFQSADIEETEFVEDERLESIIESIFFASDRPVGLGAIKQVFKGTNIKTDRIKRTIEQLSVEYAGGRRGVTLEEVPGGWQLRTKVDNLNFLRRTLKARTFKLSGPALEVLSIVAYKQPVVKHEIDEVRGVESGHLLRALMEKGLVTFEGKSELPGRPMQYGTTKKFLEIFTLRNIKELPTLSQIDELLPDGIDEDQAKKETLSDVTTSMSEKVETSSYSVGEEELEKIQEQLQQISTSSDFFEQEKQRQKEQRDKEKAQNIRDALTVGEKVSTRDMNWLKKYDDGTLYAKAAGEVVAAEVTEVKVEAAVDIETATADAGVNNEALAIDDDESVELAMISEEDLDDSSKDNEI